MGPSGPARCEARPFRHKRPAFTLVKRTRGACSEMAMLVHNIEILLQLKFIRHRKLSGRDGTRRANAYRCPPLTSSLSPRRRASEIATDTIISVIAMFSHRREWSQAPLNFKCCEFKIVRGGSRDRRRGGQWRFNTTSRAAAQTTGQCPQFNAGSRTGRAR